MRKLRAMKSMGFTVFSYTHALITRSHYSRYLQIYFAHNIITNTKYSEKNNRTSHSTQPNSTHVHLWATVHHSAKSRRPTYRAARARHRVY